MTYSQEKVNDSRQFEVDCVKTLAIVFMVIIHVYEEISVVNVDIPPEGFFHNFLQFMAGPLAAPMFMFAMGLGTIYTSKRSPEEIMKRGLKIFISSYILNIVRSVIPYFIGIKVFGYSYDQSLLFYELFNVDILQFAGLALIAIGFFKKLGLSLEFVGIIAVFLLIIGPMLPEVIPHEGNIRYFYSLFFYADEVSYFPFTHWFIYPVAGMLFAKYLKHINDLDKFYKGVLYVTTLVIIGSVFGFKYYGFDLQYFYSVAHHTFYKQTFVSFIFALSCILCELSIFHFVRIKNPKSNIEQAIKYISTNLTNIYYVQWLFVGWLELLFRCKVSVPFIIPMGILITLASVSIVYIINLRKDPAK